jgi:hypothetical protein
MTTKPRSKADPFEHEIELVLNPGVFIPDRPCFPFVGDLDGVAAKIARWRCPLPSACASRPVSSGRSLRRWWDPGLPSEAVCGGRHWE